MTIRLLLAALVCACLVTPAYAVSLNGVHHELRSKVESILTACPGSRVISAIRHTRIAGTRHMSLHASGRAVDMTGNPSCIYGQLQGWPGGVSMDYARVRHVHISIGGPEQGLRFAHGGLRKKARRYARTHRRAPQADYATAWPQ